MLATNGRDFLKDRSDKRPGQSLSLCGHLQPKLDGWRVIADVQTGALFTKSGKQCDLPAGSQLVEELKQLRPSLGDTRFVDGELVHPNGRDFIPSALRDAHLGSNELVYHIFDCVSDAAFVERSNTLAEAFSSASGRYESIQLVMTTSFAEEETPDMLQEMIDSHQDSFIDAGLEGAILRLDAGGKQFAGYEEDRRSQRLLKFKPRETTTHMMFALQETKKGSGKLGSIRCLVDFSTRRFKYFTAHAAGMSDALRREAWENRPEYAANHVDVAHRDDFDPQWKAVIESDGTDKSGTPRAARLVGFRHIDDMLPSQWSAVRMIDELEGMLTERGGGVEASAAVCDTVTHMMKRTTTRAAANSEHVETQIKKMLFRYEHHFGPGPLRTMLQKGVELLARQSTKEGACLLEFYNSGRDVRELSVHQLCDLVGSQAVGRDARKSHNCVYVHATSFERFDEVGDIIADLEVSPRSVAQQERKLTLQQWPAEHASLLTYVGFTSSRTVAQRIELDEYASNKLMASLWSAKEPMSLVAFQLPEMKQRDRGARGQVLHFIEFLVVELLGTFGSGGMNLQPGGPMSFLKQSWASFDECMAIVQDLGFQSRDEFHAWCKENPEKRLELGMPYNPDKAFANDDWDGWYAFMDTTPPVTAATRASYDECAAHVQDLGLQSQDEFLAWCKENPEKRLELGLPTRPDRDFANDDWDGWKHFLKTSQG